MGVALGFLWPMTPIGGTILIASWSLFVQQAIKIGD